jgi:putative SOS response-associated peptidase YedK
MCGRYSAATQPRLFAERFQAQLVEGEGYRPNWNVAPASDILVVATREDGVRELRPFHWGLIPKWAKDASARNQIINMRAETVRDKPTWRRLLARHRGLLPIDGFYEWQDLGRGRGKQPFYITTRDQQPLALAGLWETWRDPATKSETKSETTADQGTDAGDGDRVRSFTILTTTPNELMGSIHNRMPVIIPPDKWDTWLDSGNTDVDALAELLVPAPEELLMVWPVDPAVGSVRNNGPELTEPLEGHEPRIGNSKKQSR